MTVASSELDRLAPLGRTARLARPAAGRVALSGLLGAGAVAADIGLFGTAAWMISKASQHPNEASLALAIVAVQVFGLSRGLFRYAERLVGHDAAFRLLVDVRVHVYERLERITPAGLPHYRRGDLLARVVQDVDSLQDLVLRVLPPFGIAGLVGTLTVALLWLLLPAAGLILAAVSLVLAATVVPLVTGAMTERRESRFARARGELAAAVVDLTEGAAELVAFGASDDQVAIVRSHDAELRRIAAASAGTACVGLALTTLLAGVASWGCLMVGIATVASGRMDPTNLAVITLVPLASLELVVGLPVATQTLKRTRQASARVFELTDAPVPVVEPDAPAPPPDGPFPLVVTDVTARYPDAEVDALSGVDLELGPGRRVAVVGPSGAGKTTLGSVLVRFLDYRSGSITAGGTPLDELDGDEARRMLCLVGQDPYLFDTTIAENLRLGRRAASDDELAVVLDRVGLAPWLEELPHGLATEVGRHGAKVSGGQAQRLALARALLSDVEVLVLDEPAEHLDAQAADELTADLLAMADGQALVVITHRLAGLEGIDEIVVLDDGRVVERGSHDDLLVRDGRYASLWFQEMTTTRHALRTPTDTGRRRYDTMAAGRVGTSDDGSLEP